MLELHTFPQGQQLSEGEVVQIRKIQSGQYVFRDCYFHELQEGDQYIIPEQVEIPLASDTEILDFLLTNQPKIGWTISDLTDGTSSVHAFERDHLDEIDERRYSTGDTPALLGSFREMMTDIINNQEL